MPFFAAVPPPVARRLSRPGMTGGKHAGDGRHRENGNARRLLPGKTLRGQTLPAHSPEEAKTPSHSFSIMTDNRLTTRAQEERFTG